MYDIKSLFANQEKTPEPSKIRAQVETYARAVASGDTKAILRLFALDATQEDPVGGPVYRGHEGIENFFQSSFDAFKSGPNFRTEGKIRVAGRVAVANMVTDVTTASPPFRVYSSDVFTFNKEGLITSLKAYWGETDVQSIS